jgi:hypothetical protein
MFRSKAVRVFFILAVLSFGLAFLFRNFPSVKLVSANPLLSAARKRASALQEIRDNGEMSLRHRRAELESRKKTHEN